MMNVCEVLNMVKISVQQKVTYFYKVHFLWTIVCTLISWKAIKKMKTSGKNLVLN